MTREEFLEKVIELLYKIPRGKVTTYKLIAEKIGVKSYRFIGTLVGDNYTDAPCHRVVKSDGTLGGYKHAKSGHWPDEKKKKLMDEGILFKNGKIVDFENVLFKFDEI